MSDAVAAGVHAANVTAWMCTHVDGVTPPLDFAFIPGGHSNLTLEVRDAAGRRLVLRRPPLSHGLASAHDMGREHRIISGLWGSAVPVARALGYCDDPAVNGAPFFVMDFVEGHVVRDRATAERVWDAATRRRASESLVETLAAIHAADLGAAGLADLGRHEGYVTRQLKRWHGQWHAQKTRELPLIDEVHDELSRRIPDQGPATIVHGDFRLDNCIVGDDGAVRAVLDWEICTLGDPLADLGLFTVYWTGPGDEASPWLGQATTAPGFMDRSELVARYARATGRDVGNIEYYRAFAYWKLACIVEGVYARYLGGALGARSSEELEPFRLQVEAAAGGARRSLDLLA
jgi:aminoglycoside phosphotransferase (APT) family kinase protein